jgi:hypothetical protein
MCSPLVECVVGLVPPLPPYGSCALCLHNLLLGHPLGLGMPPPCSSCYKASVDVWLVTCLAAAWQLPPGFEIQSQPLNSQPTHPLHCISTLPCSILQGLSKGVTPIGRPCGLGRWHVAHPWSIALVGGGWGVDAPHLPWHPWLSGWQAQTTPVYPGECACKISGAST